MPRKDRAGKRAWEREFRKRPHMRRAARVYGRSRGRELRERVIRHYGGQCSCECRCDESNPVMLTLDHINGDGAYERRVKGWNGAHMFRAVIRLDYPNRYRLLCWNCNCGRSQNGGVCPRIMRVQSTEFDPRLIKGPADAVHPRSPGLHISRIYQDLAQTLGIVKPVDSSVDLGAYRAMGFVWEHVVDAALAKAGETGNVVRLGEFKRDGIIGSPDLIDLDTWTVVETKATWKSAKKFDDLEKHFWLWVVQLKSYCFMVETLHAKLVVMFVNGDWSPPVPTIRQADIWFTERELLDNWSMITQHARSRGWL